jgi:phage baseplate assembly protein W
MQLQDIKAKDWSISTTKQGEVVQGINDIHQCIAIIITTAKGSDPLRPEFGCDIRAYLDKPTSNVPRMIREVTQAIEIWETRVQVTKVTAKLDISHVTLTIEWKTIAGIASDTTVTI